MELDRIVREQHQLIHLRQETLEIIDAYIAVLEEWGAIESKIKTKWRTNFEQAFKELFGGKGFVISEENQDGHFKMQAKLGCCKFYIAFDQYDTNRIIFGVANPENDGPFTANQKVDDIRYKLLLEGPINKYTDITLKGQKYPLITINDITFLKQQMGNNIVTLKELGELHRCLVHNKAAEEHYIMNQGKIKLITTSTQYGVFQTLEELIERM